MSLRGAARVACTNACYDLAIATTMEGCVLSSPSTEVCDGRDNDCNRQVDDGFAAVTETCDNVDNNCNGLVDDLPPQACDTGLLGVCSPGTQSCQAGASGACTQTVQPSAELCNNVDDNCDGQVDNGINLQTDVNNCGSCGTACAANQNCQAGTCVTPVTLYVGVSGESEMKNSGGNWVDLQNFGDVHSIWCRDAQTCLLGSGSVGIYKTTNGGERFDQVHNPGVSVFEVMCLKTDLNRCYAVGNQGLLLKSSDGGSQWSPENSRSRNQLQSISCTQEGWCVFVAYNGESYSERFIFDARDISNQPTGLNAETFLSVSCARNSCIAGGTRGLLVRITDNGNTWTTLPAPQSAVEDVFCIDSLSGSPICYVVGRQGMILKTTDSGSTWVPQNSGVNADLKSISCTNVDRCWAVGQNGVLLSTANGGTEWERDMSAELQGKYLISVVAVEG